MAHAVHFAAGAARSSDGIWRVVAEGDLDMATAAQLDAVLGDPSLADATVIELDLSGVSFLDSSGLRSIVQFATGLERRGGRLVISGMSAAAQRVLEVTGVLERLRERAAPE